MPYHPDISKKPITILALWDSQVVQVCDRLMYLTCKANSDKVFLTYDLGQVESYSTAWDRYMEGHVGFTNSPPIYSEYHLHIRKGRPGDVASTAMFTRDELLDVIASGNYYVG